MRCPTSCPTPSRSHRAHPPFHSQYSIDARDTWVNATTKLRIPILGYVNASDYTNDEGPQSSTIATIGLATGEDFIGKFSMTGTWPSDVVSYDDEVTRPLELLCAGDLGLGLVAYYYVDGETNDVYPTKDQLVIPKASGNAKKACAKLSK